MRSGTKRNDVSSRYIFDPILTYTSIPYDTSTTYDYESRLLLPLCIRTKSIPLTYRTLAMGPSFSGLCNPPTILHAIEMASIVQFGECCASSVNVTRSPNTAKRKIERGDSFLYARNEPSKSAVRLPGSIDTRRVRSPGRPDLRYIYYGSFGKTALTRMRINHLQGGMTKKGCVDSSRFRHRFD